MGSIHDQLLKVGLVDAQQVKKAKLDKRNKDKRRRKSKTKTDKPDKPQQRPALAEKIERDRELNRRRQQRAERKAIAAQIKQLIETSRQATGDGDLPFNFADHKKIKRIYITEVEREQLSRGTLAIVKFNGKYELVPSTIVEKIRLRDEKYVILCNEPQEKNGDHADDPYSDYQVPDDLVW